jgi:hypothetical protein
MRVIALGAGGVVADLYVAAASRLAKLRAAAIDLGEEPAGVRMLSGAGAVLTLSARRQSI